MNHFEPNLQKKKQVGLELQQRKQKEDKEIETVYEDQLPFKTTCTKLNTSIQTGFPFPIQNEFAESQKVSYNRHRLYRPIWFF